MGGVLVIMMARFRVWRWARMAGAGQGRAEDYQAVLELYSRLANHRPFLQGEVRHFVREFEIKRGDREVENIFGVLERVSELRDCGLPGLLERAGGGEAARLVGGLQVAQSMVERVLRGSETGEVEASLASSREAREREWVVFQEEARSRVRRVEARDREQEEAIRRRYKDLEASLHQ